MAQEIIRSFISDLTAAVELQEPIVEFGSLQVEPEQKGNLRPLFGEKRYIGTDLRDGPGVDRIEDLRKLSFRDGEVGTALCLDTLEHCENPILACREMHRVLAEGGLCVISSVMLFGIHAYPNDYWRFTPEGFRVLLSDFDDAWVTGIGDPAIPTQVIGVGAKARPIELSLERLPSLEAAQAGWERARGKVRIGPFRTSPGMAIATLVRELPRALSGRPTRSP